MLKKQFSRCALRMAMAAGLILASPIGNAQVSTAYEEQSQLIRAPRAAASFGPDLFGDTVNLYNGQVPFRQTDVSLKGNNRLPVEIGPRISAGQNVLGGRAFGRWELDIPHIHGIFPANLKFPALFAGISSDFPYISRAYTY